jgi:kynureninase
VGGPRRIYLDGNSLGPPSPGTVEALTHLVEEEWGRDLIGAWTTWGWWDLPVAVGERIAPLLGAAPGQVVVGDSTTVLWYKLLGAAMRLRDGRSTIVTQLGSFPTDRHVIDAVAAQTGARVVAVPSEDLAAGCDEILDEHTGVLAVTHVDYRTGYRLDLHALTRAAHEVGAIALWDLSHSVGAMDLELDAAGVDLAVGCTYKYLNGGPGSPAFAYVAAPHLATLDQPLPGWVGHADPFSMDERHRPASGIRRVLSGSPSVLALRALAVALDRFAGVDLAALRAHSVALTDRCIQLADEWLVPLGVELATTRHSARRGSHVSLRHPHAWEVVQAAIEVGVVGDHRPPDLIRLGFAPLHLTLDDVDEAMDRLAYVVESRRWEHWVGVERPTVT